ncbi:NADH:flavin oxidoreductase/NADH oxidase [Rhodovarius lipocyclicus]|uniref:NADH:flavin oxidoreductase/NADH oxidase n=1 Tax=Rhodovarius lipocyclicus TaxID=268410 RepID=UPI00135A3E82|nr:NADH:flavin oxidoreductase/NADH oxidase [Rhodovarius lipocyclicus]
MNAANPNSGEDARRVQRPSNDPFLFRPLTLRGVTARNRIMLAPLCEYSATDGVANDWHLVHLGARAIGGAGIICTEATHVSPEGRITPHCLGLWNAAQRDALARVVDFIVAHGATPAIQISHAGRKASVARPWEGGGPLSPEQGGWQTFGPSARPFTQAYPTPQAMTKADIARVTADFAHSARLALQAGFQIAELHGAHGYLLHQFLSPLVNEREDEYGGSLENRARFLLEVVAAVRAEWPKHLPLFVRLSCTDWVEGGLSADETVEVCRMLAATGDVDLIDASSGGADPRQKIRPSPGYQVPFAERIRREAGIATGAVGMINTPDLAEEILANGRADLIIMGRKLMADPHWPLKAAAALHVAGAWVPQYERAAPMV